MKRSYQIGILIIVLVLITQFLNMQVNHNANTSKYIQMNYSREWRVLFLNIQQLESAIADSINKKEHGNENEEIKMIIREIDLINYSLMGYVRLNQKYGLSIYPMLDLLKPIEDKIESNENLTKEDLMVVKAITELNEKYSVIRQPALYESNSSRFKSINLPTEVIDYVDEIEILEQELSLQ